MTTRTRTDRAYGGASRSVEARAASGAGRLEPERPLTHDVDAAPHPHAPAPALVGDLDVQLAGPADALALPDQDRARHPGEPALGQVGAEGPRRRTGRRVLTDPERRVELPIGDALVRAL